MACMNINIIHNCNLSFSFSGPEHQDIIMRRLSDRRRRSFDSGIVDVGNSRCPHLNVTCPAHMTIALAPNSANQVKLYSKQHCIVSIFLKMFIINIKGQKSVS